MKIKNSDHRGDPLYSFQIFSRVSNLNFFGLYQNKYRFGFSKYPCIRIDKNILEIDSLFFYEHLKFRPQGDPLYTFQIFSNLGTSGLGFYLNKCNKVPFTLS